MGVLTNRDANTPTLKHHAGESDDFFQSHPNHNASNTHKQDASKARKVKRKGSESGDKTGENEGTVVPTEETNEETNEEINEEINVKPAKRSQKRARQQQQVPKASELRIFAKPGDEEQDGEEEVVEGDDEEEEEAEEEVDANNIRRAHGIHVKGHDIPAPATTFQDMEEQLGVPNYLIRNLTRPVREGGLGYATPTAIQMQAVPLIVSGRELLAGAPTGSGKTAAFLLPLLSLLHQHRIDDQKRKKEEEVEALKKKGEQKVKPTQMKRQNKNAPTTKNRKKQKQAQNTGSDDDEDDDENGGDEINHESDAVSTPSSSSSSGSASCLRAIILAPTRELATQIFRHANTLAQGGGWHIVLLSKANCNLNSFDNHGHGKDLVIATPLLLAKLLHTPGVDFKDVEWLVLDEADTLFDQGFAPQLDQVLEKLNPSVHKCMFSATILQGVEEMVRTVMKDPVRVTIGHRNAACSAVKQRLLFVGNEDGKIMAFRTLMQDGLKVPCLIFVQSKERAEQLLKLFSLYEWKAEVMHANLSPTQREAVITRVRSGEAWLLICTDLMARGFDFKGVQSVINWDFPLSTVSYVHRIGRTGRAGRPGEAITMWTTGDEKLLSYIATLMHHSGADVPPWMLALPRPKKAIMVAPPREGLVKGMKKRTLGHRPKKFGRKRPEEGPAQGSASSSSSSSSPATEKSKKANAKVKQEKLRKKWKQRTVRMINRKTKAKQIDGAD